jgi:hypothetical protein
MIRNTMIVLLGCAVATLMGGLAAESPKAPPLDLKGTRILVSAGYWAGMVGMPALKKLTDAGAQVGFCPRANLTWEELQKYHMAVIIFDQTDKMLQRSEEALQKFVQSGGGVFFFWTSFEPKDAVNECLAPFGASLLKEYVRDPQHTFASPAGFYGLSYAYTKNIAAGHPVTEGVQGLCYDVDTQSGCLFGTSAIGVSKDWTTLVSGEASATTFAIEGQLLPDTEIEGAMRPGKCQSSPPIIAARDFGSGALVFAGPGAIEMFYGQGLPYYGDVAIDKGDGMRRSDFGRLYENALRWLAQHGKKSNLLGKGKLKPTVNENEKAKRINWSDPNILAGSPCTKPIKGVIGLHSTLSDGKDTSEALIAKAKASGLQWVAFTEKMEILADGKWTKKPIQQTAADPSPGERTELVSPDKWEQLRKICKEASTDDFVALPGLDYADNLGDRWVVFGDFVWPEEKVFSPDKKKIIKPTWWFLIGPVPNGPYDVGHNKLHLCDYQLFDMWPIRTTVAGKRIDVALPSFKYHQGVQDKPSPMAVDMVYSEKELAAAAGRMCNYLTMDKPRDLAKTLKETSSTSGVSFVSDGPLVTDWRCENEDRDTFGAWYLASTEQYRVKLSVESASPISDIKIYDGPKLLQRFCPNQPKVTVTADLPHDKQRNLFAVITDANDKHAVTRGHFIRDLLNFRFMCGDRANAICDSTLVDEAGPYITGPTAPYQRKQDLFPIFGGYAMRAFMISPPGVDGGMRPIGMDVVPSLFYQFAIDPQQPKMWPRLQTRMEVPVCSRDGMLQEHTSTGITDNSKGDGSDSRQVPWDLKDVEINVRYLCPTMRPGDMSTMLLEGRIGFLKDVKINGPLGIFGTSVVSKPGNGDHYAIATPEQTITGLNQTAQFWAESPMTPGSYAMIFPAQLGSTGAMALDDGYSALVDAAYPHIRINVRLNSTQGREMKAGDELKYRLLLIHGRPGEMANTADWESFAKKLGLRGRPGYEVKDIKAGKVKGTKFLLELEPEDGGFAGAVSQSDLPIRLPVRVADMNPNWTFAWFDLDRKEWFPSAVDQVINQGFFTLDTRRGAHRIFAGHPVVADDKELRILTLSDGQSTIKASVNNVSAAAVDAVVRLNPALGKVEPVKIHLVPGEVKNLTFSFGP